jgi:predicted  nucleic acid-binding Zn-ribbon protein
VAPNDTIDNRITRLETRAETEVAALARLVEEVEKLRRDLEAVRLEVRELVVATQTERRMLRAAAAVIAALAGAAGWVGSLIFEAWKR